MVFKLKQKNDKLGQVHCVVHRLNLAAAQASNGIQCMEDYRRHIQMLYRLFSYSQVRYDKLRKLQNLLHGQAKQVPEGASVWSLSVESAVKMSFENIDAIVLTLEDDKDDTGKAAGLWKFFATSLFSLITALLIDVLTVIGIHSLTFQKDSVNLASVRPNVDSTIETLITMRHGSTTVNEVAQMINQAYIDGQSELKYKDVQIKHNAMSVRKFEGIRNEYLDKLIQNLEDLFPKEELSLLECFDALFNPKRYPNNNLATLGNNQLDTLCAFYSNIINSERCKGRFCSSSILLCHIKLIMVHLTSSQN